MTRLSSPAATAAAARARPSSPTYARWALAWLTFNVSGLAASKRRRSQTRQTRAPPAGGKVDYEANRQALIALKNTKLRLQDDRRWEWAAKDTGELGDYHWATTWAKARRQQEVALFHTTSFTHSLLLSLDTSTATSLLEFNGTLCLASNASSPSP
jgi:hypothetical protein